MRRAYGAARKSAQSLHSGQFLYTGRSALIGFLGAPADQSLRTRSRPISRVLSRTIIHLRYASPRTSSDLPGSTCGPHVRPHPRTRPPAPLFGLAPGGVCRAAECCHRRGALLPHPFTLTAPLRGVGGLLSVALSVGSRPPGVTWRLALGARTFLHACAQRLPGRLRA